MVKIDLEPPLPSNKIGPMLQTAMIQREKGRGKYGIIGLSLPSWAPEHGVALKDCTKAKITDTEIESLSL